MPAILTADMSDEIKLDPHSLRVLISAGEASGEMYGAELLTELRKQVAEPGNAAPLAAGSNIECFGMGGERMKEAGCELVVQARDVSVVGLVEVISHLPGIYAQFQKLLDEVDRRKPDVAVLIDFPDWNFRLARQLHKRGIPVVYYVSPQLWAWRKSRLKLVQRYVAEMLVIFPFEREFYARHGVQAEFVGHPLSERRLPGISREEFAKRWALDASKTWIALLPGSRRKELRLNLPAMLGAAERLGKGFEFVMPVASTLEYDWVREQIELCTRSLAIRLTNDPRASLLHSRVGVVASGTATVEAALIGTPFVMVYRVAGLTWAVGRHLVKLPHYGMVNLVAGREVVPELIQERFTPESVEAGVKSLLEDGRARQTMIAALAEVREKLRGELRDTPTTGQATETTAGRAARAVLRVAEMASRERE